MKRIFRVLFLIILLLPLNCFALTSYEETDAEIMYYIDDSYWTPKDLSKERDYLNRKWANDCGTILTSVSDVYGSMSKEDLDEISHAVGLKSMEREYYNYKNFFTTNDIGETFINTLNSSGVYNITNWEYYDTDKMKFIKYIGTMSSSGITLDTEGYITINNGYLFMIAFSRYAPVNTVTCEKPISDIIDTMSPINEPKILSGATNNIDSALGLSLWQILFGILLTALCYMIVPFILVVLCKKKYDKYGARRMAMWNSIIVGIIFAILTLILYQGQAVWSAAPAFLYYFINSHVWIFREKKEKSEEKRKEKDDNKKHSEKNEISEPVEVIKKIEEEPVKEEVKEEPKKKEVINKDVLVCSNCGNIINASDTKCKKCGEKLAEEKDEKIKIGILSKKQPKTSLDQKYSDLKKLKELLDDGIITKKEFDEEKSKIMGE